MSELDVKREDGPTGGRYLVTIDGHTAEMTYSKAGATRIIIDHTGVPDALRGKGAGQALVGVAARSGLHVVHERPSPGATMVSSGRCTP